MRFSIVLFLLLGVLPSCTLPQHYEDFNVLHRERGDYVLTLAPSTRPHLGKNRFRATLTDSTGKAITDARITFHYSMHGMRGAEKGALTDNGVYEVEVDLVMGGEWTISIEIERPGIEKIREKFIIDAGPY